MSVNWRERRLTSQSQRAGGEPATMMVPPTPMGPRPTCVADCVCDVSAATLVSVLAVVGPGSTTSVAECVCDISAATLVSILTAADVDLVSESQFFCFQS